MLMLILLMMLAVGVSACVAGFMVSFLPARWEKFTEGMTFASRWTDPSPKRVHPLIRFGNRVAGMAFLAVGCWFTYVAASEIYLVLTGRAASHAAPPVTGVPPSTSTAPLTAFSVFTVVAGVLMAVFPGRALAVFERVWPSGRSVKPLAAPKVMLFIRLFGAALAFLGIMSLLR